MTADTLAKFLVGLQIFQTVVMLVAAALAFVVRKSVSSRQLDKDVAQLRIDVNEVERAAHKFRNYTMPDLLKAFETKEHAQVVFEEGLRARADLKAQVGDILTRLRDDGR